MSNFCTYFDKNYLSRFLVLRNSINQFKKKNNYYVLYLDEIVKNFFQKKNFNDVILISLDEIEEKYKQLNKAKGNRSLIEYYFTLSPFLPKYIYEIFKINKISYLDSDLYFFQDPEKLIRQEDDSSIILIKQESKLIYGNFNVGWIIFNFNFTETRKIVDKWSNQCIKSCTDFPDPSSDVYADQKYLDSWPKKLKNLKILYPGYSCLSPWDKNDVIENNIDSMITYHFHGFSMTKNNFSTGFYQFNKKPSNKIIKSIYHPYLRDLKYIEKKYKLSSGSIRASSINSFQNTLRVLRSKFKKFIFNDEYYFSN